MPDSDMLLSTSLFLAVGVGAFALLAFLSSLLQGDTDRGLVRLQRLAAPEEAADARAGRAGPGVAFLAKVGVLLTPGRERRARLEARMGQAGLYSPDALLAFLGAKLLLTIALPVAAVLAVALAAPPSQSNFLLAGVAGVVIGTLLPDMWLDARRRKYQTELRRTLPDALDLLVLCVEGGGSLTSAVHRVTEDLEMAHPLLTAELRIVLREIQMGLSTGEAFKRFGERCGLEDVRDLASVMLQSERFGAGVAKALRIHADVCRADRQQRAEEMAQKAAVKILFPTLLCIFPAIFIVLLGPAMYQMTDMLSKTR